MRKILFADDDDATRIMMSDLLTAAGFSVEAVRDGAAALDAVRQHPPDLVLLDYRMGKPDGFEVCRTIKHDPRLEYLPVLILTGEGAVEDRLAGFAAGTDDYLPKPFDARELLARIRALLRITEQGRELNPTSGLPGGEAIQREFDRRRAAIADFTLCYLDLDSFKPFNDHFGFPIADAVIGEVGSILKRVVAGTDAFAGHIGGDDFVLICDRWAARSLVERARRSFQEALTRFVPAEVVEAGVYPGRSREGVEEQIPLTRLAAALLHLHPARSPDLARLGEVAADAKRRAKTLSDDGLIEIDVVT
jgi:PleD family two-component response regulator